MSLTRSPGFTQGMTMTQLQSLSASMTGTPLFSQISSAARSSVMGAFSLRAVNGTSIGGTAKAVRVQAQGQFPPNFSPYFASTAVQVGNQFTQSFPNAYSGVLSVMNGNYTCNCSSFVPDAVTNREACFNAFDSNTQTYWENNYFVQAGYGGVGAGGSNSYNGSYTTIVSGSSIGGEWLQVGLPTAIILNSYSMYGRSGWSFRMPYQFVVAGSNDGITWTTVDSQNGINTWSGQTPITFTTTSSTPWFYFRLITQAIQGNGTASDLNIAQWTLYSSNVSWQNDFYADRLGNLLTAPVVGQSLADWLGGATGYVTTWYDQSGLGNHATQATAANQPVIQKATKGPGYMVNFNGTSQFVTLSASYNFLNGTNLIVNAVALRTATVSQPNYIIGTNSPTVSYQRFFLGFASDTSISMPVTGAPTAITIPAYNASNEPVIYMTGGLTPSRVLYKNDTLGGTNVDTALLSVPSGYSYSIGYTVGAATYYHQGNLFELLIFTSALDQTQVTQIYQNQLSYTGT